MRAHKDDRGRDPGRKLCWSVEDRDGEIARFADAGDARDFIDQLGWRGMKMRKLREEETS